MDFLKKTQNLTFFLILLFPSTAHADGSGIAPRTIVISLFIIFICILIPTLLYYAALSGKNLKQGDGVVSAMDLQGTGLSEATKKKAQNLPIGVEKDPRIAIKAIVDLVAAETVQVKEAVRREYAEKFQVFEELKNQEIVAVKEEFKEVQNKYETTKTEFKKVEKEKKTTESVVKSIAEGIVVVNQKGEVLLMNPSAEKLLGMEKEKKIGKSILDGARKELMISMSRDGAENSERVVEYQGADENTRKILRQSSAIIQNENGQTVGMVNILTDITKQRELDDIKNKFISNVTHELRTPIVAIQKAVDIVVSQASGPLNETQLNFLKIVSRNLAHLIRLVEDLLDISKIDAGKMQIRFTKTKLEPVIENACDSLSTWAKSKDIQIVRNLEENLPEVELDSGKITQVLNNLIGNSIKFTEPNGKITVTGRRRQGTDKVEVIVEDTGVGIAKENLPRLFQRFEQFGKQAGIEGTGLGLSISKEIVERHGGNIFVESQEGKGSKFTFTLLLKQP